MKRWMSLICLLGILFSLSTSLSAVQSCTIYSFAVNDPNGALLGCCTGYYCSDEINGMSCGSCSFARNSGAHHKVKPRATELAGVEKLTVNGKSLSLRWSRVA